MEDNLQSQAGLSTSRKFAKNAFFNIAGFVVTSPILILLTPYMLEVLGKAKFGVWALAAVVTSYAHLSDLGMTTALVKFVPEHWAKRDVGRISGIVSTAFSSFAVVGGLISCGIILLRHFIVVSLLKVPPELQPEALFVVTGVVIIFYLNLLFSVYNSVLLGIQRMDVTNGIMVVSKVLQALGIYYFLANGFGLRGLIINSAIFSFLTIGCNIFWAKRLMVRLKINPLWFSFSELRKIVKYSINVFLATLMGLAQDPINKIILAAYTSLPFVSFYEVGWRVKQIVRQLFQVGLLPLLPASSELHSVAKKQEMERMYLSISRMLYLFAVPFFLLVIFLAEPLVQVWLGDGYKLAARAIQFLLLGNLFSLLVTPQYVILQGIGKPQLSTFVSGVNGFANVAIAIVLVRLIGYYGVLLAVLLSLFSASILMMYLFHRATGYSFLGYIQSLPLKPLTIGCGFVGGLWLISKHINNWGILSLFGVSMVFFVLYIVAISGLLKADEKKLFSKLKVAILNPRNTIGR
jgi:O-antigen/teichoic acid export membrane protein